MKKVLVIEDNRTILKLEQTKIESELHLEVTPCETLAAALAAIEKETFFCALVDLTLPDAKDLEVVQALDKYDIPMIVFTGSIDKKLREDVLKFNVMDYILKDNPSSLDYALRIIRFLDNSEGCSLLVVDDSATSRMGLVMSLERLHMNVYQASNGDEALDIIKNHDDIMMMITDNFMPGMDGDELVRKVRAKKSINDFGIIGVSGSSDHEITLGFLKSGANDFIQKPIYPEELFTRVVSNIEMIHNIKIAKESATRDYLTQLHNRMYLFELGDKYYENAKRRHLNLVVAMLDIDHFKKINDRYGHHAGDVALKEVAQVLLDNVRGTDVVARYGGEEFCIVLSNTSLADGLKVLDKIRVKISEIKIKLKTIEFSFTMSIGATDKLVGSLDKMIDHADKGLYQAKDEGRDRVVAI